MTRSTILHGFFASITFTTIHYTAAYADQSIAQVRIIVTKIFCEHTTEQGHDEVYYVLGGVDGRGEATSKRGPTAEEGADADSGTAWDMNDNGDKQDRPFAAVIYEGQLTVGQSATIDVAFLESDGTDIGQVVKAAAGLAQLIAQDQSMQTAGKVFDTIGKTIPKNQDDPLGSFRLTLARSDSGVVLQLAPGQYARVLEGFDKATGNFAMYFDHDGGRYRVYFTVKELTQK